MKTEARVMDVTSTLQGEKIGMSIEDGALAHIMSVLTDLYSDPELAVIREYSTNALDAHIEAGVPLPIEVTLPTTLSPYLKIRDYGSGLDIEDIRNIYSRYGASTKRDSNDLVGTLGLGCKSALTYTDQFTLQGVKNGKCTQVSISRDEDGAGSMTVVATYDTDEPSGVEITVPVKARNDFEEKAEYFFSFWNEGSVLVNGKAPERITGIEIDSDLFVVARDKLDVSVVVMGNVAYPMENYGSGLYSSVAYVPIGAVQFTPAREALQMTTKTTKVIQEIKERVAQGRKPAAERMIAEAVDKAEALRISLSVSRLFSLGDKLLYKGEEIPTEFAHPMAPNEDGVLNDEMYENFITVTHKPRRYGRMQERVRKLPISIVGKTIFLTNYKNKTLSPTGRKKLLQWWNEACANHDGMTVDSFVLVNTLPHAEWIDPAHVYDFAVVAEQKLPKDTSSRKDGKPAGSYLAIVNGVLVSIQADEIDTTKPIFFTYDSYNGKGRKIVREVYPDATIVELTTNRVNKFRRMFPQAKELTEAAFVIGQAWADSLTQDELIMLSYDKSDRTALSRLDATLINDPSLIGVIKTSAKKNDALLQAERQFSGFYVERKFDDPLDKYPLLMPTLGTMYYMNQEQKDRTLDHLYLYVNAVYEKETI